MPATVGELALYLIELRPSLTDLTRAIFGHWPKSTPIDAAWLEKLSRKAESIRRQVAVGANTAATRQAGYFVLLDLTVPLVGAVAGQAMQGKDLRAQLICVLKLMAFALTDRERKLVTQLVRRSAMQITHYAWVAIASLQEMEKRLHLGTPITAQLTSPSEPDFSLSHEFNNPSTAFSQTLKLRRRQVGLTPKQLASRAGVPLSQIYAWQRGHSVPGYDNLEAVKRLAAILDSTDLVPAFYATRAAQDELTPRAPARDIRFINYLTPAHEAQLKDFFDFENHRYGVSRGGKKDSGGPLAPNSVKSYIQIISRVLAYLQLPANAADARLRGLGWPGSEVSFIDLGQPRLLERMFGWYFARNGRDDFASGDSAILYKLLDIFRPQTGYVWLRAEQLAATSAPASIDRCPAIWQKGSGSPGQPCRDAAERIRALCYDAYAYMEPRARKARGSAPGPRHLQDLAAAMTHHRHLLEALFVILKSAALQKAPSTVAEAIKVESLAILAIDCWHPPRPSDYGKMRLEHIVLGQDGRVIIKFNPRKNGGSTRAKTAPPRTMPRELAPYMVQYLREARPLLAAEGDPANPWVFLSARGRALPVYEVRRMLMELARTDERTIARFPHGLRPRYTRTIVATDLVTRFGRAIGSLLAADALVDHASTASRSYIVLEPDPSFQQSGTATQDAAITAAHRRIFGHSPQGRARAA